MNLGNIVGLAAFGVTAFGATEYGWRKGVQRGNDANASYVGNALLRSTSGGSENILFNPIQDAFSNSLLDETPLKTVNKYWNGVTGAVGNIAQNWLPLTATAIGAIAGGPLGWIAAGCIGVGALWDGLKSSGRIADSPKEKILDVSW